MNGADADDSLLADARKEVKSLRDELFSIRRSAWEAQRNASGAAAELADAQATIANLRGKAEAGDSATKQVKTLTAELTHLRDVYEGATHELKKHRASRSILDGELTAARQAVSDLSREVAALQADRGRAAEALESKSAQVLLLKKQLVDAEEEVRPHRVS